MHLPPHGRPVRERRDLGEDAWSGTIKPQRFILFEKFLTVDATTPGEACNSTCSHFTKVFGQGAGRRPPRTWRAARGGLGRPRAPPTRTEARSIRAAAPTRDRRARRPLPPRRASRTWARTGTCARRRVSRPCQDRPAAVSEQARLGEGSSTLAVDLRVSPDTSSAASSSSSLAPESAVTCKAVERM